jgi:hypothetical protein
MARMAGKARKKRTVLAKISGKMDATDRRRSSLWLRKRIFV